MAAIIASTARGGEARLLLAGFFFEGIEDFFGAGEAGRTRLHDGIGFGQCGTGCSVWNLQSALSATTRVRKTRTASETESPIAASVSVACVRLRGNPRHGRPRLCALASGP